MEPKFLTFADAGASFDEAKYVIMGVPFDATTSFRNGARFAPNAIRDASWNFETFLFELGIDISEVSVFDAGNLGEFGSVDEMYDEVKATVSKVVKAGKFPILMGGEHSITPPTVEAVKAANKDLAVLVIDAHLDYRDDYLDNKRSHACASRRTSEVVGVERLAIMGVRSISKDEWEDAQEHKLRYLTASDIAKKGFKASLEEAIKPFGGSKVYLTVDVDGIDPAYAPGIGNPEPFGLTPGDVKLAIDTLAPRLVGFDFVEVCPPFDNGNTSALAARLIREVIGSVEASRKGK